MRESAFQHLKDVLANSLKNHIFNPESHVTVTTDTSADGLGAVLTQKVDGKEVPIFFASHTVSETERRFAANEREALAMVWALETWEKFLLGRRFTLRTDHTGLRCLMA